MDRIIKIDDKDVKFRATARTPRLYRALIGRDMIVDMNKLSRAYKDVVKAHKNGTEEEMNDARLSVTDLQIFEDVSYIMAKQADPEIPSTPDEWLDGFNMFSIYEIMPTILELWNLNNQTTSVPKKK